VKLGEPVPGGSELVLVVNADREPQGWIRGGTGTVTEANLLRGGTLATQGGTLRAALDACLSSPSGRGVVVDEAGRLLGSLTAREALDLIESQDQGARA
jgi:osmoprotectant transport system ATP-binding protein